MTILQNRVKCKTCGELVPKTATRVVNPLSEMKTYECYACFRDRQTRPVVRGSPERAKQEIFCTYCKYKFNSSRLVCPYCGKSEYLVRSNVKVVDLL
ncbi:MAG: hypothetical protein ABIG93_00765 [archaeon]|nr:hypothetical protein [Nanoarchaeota archaeon]